VIIKKKKGKVSVHRQILIYFPYQNGKWGTNKSQFPTEMRDRLIQPQKREKSDKGRRKGKSKKRFVFYCAAGYDSQIGSSSLLA
jgi:hypothetical protein